MESLLFRTLNADEIECRIGQIKDEAGKQGLSLLLYKDARCDMSLLDETVGAMNWQRSHSRDNANCVVSIWDADKGQWIAKEDTGTESNTEAEKGLASDSFKRACTNWGIGRELYTAPFIWIDGSMCKINNRKCFDRFSVSEISYDETRTINHLVVINEKTGSPVFTFDAGKQQAPKKQPSKKQAPAPAPAPAPEAAQPKQSVEQLQQDFPGLFKPKEPVPESERFADCEHCGKHIVPYKSKQDGHAVGIREHSELSKKLCDGHIYCPDCIKAYRTERLKNH